MSYAVICCLDGKIYENGIERIEDARHEKRAADGRDHDERGCPCLSEARKKLGEWAQCHRVVDEETLREDSRGLRRPARGAFERCKTAPRCGHRRCAAHVGVTQAA